MVSAWDFGLFRRKCLLLLVRLNWPLAAITGGGGNNRIIWYHKYDFHFSVIEWLLPIKSISNSLQMLKLTVQSKHLWKQNNRVYLSFVWIQHDFYRPLLSTVYFIPKMFSHWTRASKFRQIHWVKVSWKLLKFSYVLAYGLLNLLFSEVYSRI